MGLENTVITENEIFASIIAPDDLDNETAKEVMGNINSLFGSLSQNIFTNEYFAIFQAIKDAKRFNVILNSKHFNQIMISNIEKLLKSPNVIVTDFASDENDLQMVKEEFIELCCTRYEELQQMTVESNRFKYNLYLYLQEWASEQFRDLYAKAFKITTEGLQIGKTFLQGPKDSYEYYNKKAAEILRTSEFEEQKIPTITISKEGYADYLERQKDPMRLEKISYTGMEFIDERLGGFLRNEVVVTLGPPGGGKTRLNVNIAYNALVNGHSGLYFALESKLERTEALFIAKHLANKFGILDVDADAVFGKTYESDRADAVQAATYDLYHNEEYGKLKLIPSPLYDDEIEGILDAIWDNRDGDGFEFDWICIDHTSLVQSRKYINITDTLTNLMPKLETMAQSYRGKGLLILLPHQLTKEAIKGLLKNSNETIVGAADSTAVMKSAHTAITIFTDDDLKAKDMARIYCTKSRNSAGFPPRNVLAMLGVCEFADLEVDEDE